MLSAHTSYSVNKKNSAFSSSHNHHPTGFAVHENTFFASESPVTQDSSSMSSVTDEYDFKSADISSSAQTSTNSPIRIPEMRSNNNNNNNRATKFSSFSFYSGPPIDATGHNNQKHATQFRRSLVISPSFNSITSNQNARVETPTDSFDDSINDSRIASTQSDPAEVPTKNIGMVISPSIRALSDILTSKVSSQKNPTTSQQATISEEAEYNDEDDDNSTILLRSSHRQPSSLIDDIYSTQKQSCATFHETTSSDTLKIYVPPKGADAKSQPDLIDLNTPVVEHTNFAPNSITTSKLSFVDHDTNYNDLFESYSPARPDVSHEEQNAFSSGSTKEESNEKDGKNRTAAVATKDSNMNESSKTALDKRLSNRFSMMSENLNEFQSPALGYDEPVQSFNFMNPSINRSFSKLSNISDSFHEIGYGNDSSASDSDIQESAFSFVPSKAGTLTRQKQEQEKEKEKEKQQPVFSQKPSVRDSIRMVNDDADENESFISDVITPDLKLSNNSTPVFNTNFDKTPKIDSIPNLGYTHHNEIKSTPQLATSQRTLQESLQRSMFSSPVLLKSSPIRNTSPTFENFKNFPTEETEKKFINLTSNAQLPKSPKPKPSTSDKLPKSPKMSQQKAPYNAEKLHPAKPKQKKLTFKSIFSKNSDNQGPQNANLKKKSPLLHSDEKFSRPKSFSFNNLGHNNNNNQFKTEERKEKSKSLLSGWKRKSLGFTNQGKKDKSKTSSFFQTPQLDATPKTDNTHRKMQSNASLPALDKSVPNSTRQTLPTPHKHSNSTPTIFTKELPDLPPPSAKAAPKASPAFKNSSLLQTYGFNEASPEIRQTPIISDSPKINTFSQCPSSPAWEDNAKVIRSSSEQTIQTATSPVDLPEPQSAKIDQYSPVPFDSASLGGSSPRFDFNEKASEKDNSNNNDSSLAFNSSSTYETTEVEEEPGNSFFKPPKALGISQNVGKVSPIAPAVPTLDDSLLRTPPSISSPAFSIVNSFTASPNRYHIGDDIFPKKLGIDEIESIVSLERSRSMRSVRSAIGSERQRISHKSSILRMVQDNNDDFDEMVLPDGMVVVKSPLAEQSSLLSRGNEGDPVRKSSILKNRVSPLSSQPKVQLYNNTLKRNSMNFDDNSLLNGNESNGLTENDDFTEFIDMINFDDDSSDNLNTSFNVDTSMHINLSPVHKIQRDSSVPDFLGMETSFNSIHIGDNADNIQSQTVYSNNDYSTQVMHDAQDSTDSIEDIIKEEENLHKNLNYSTQSLVEPYQYQPPARPISGSFKGLTGPSFNSSLKPETKSAILGVLAKNQPLNAVVPSDSENSLSTATYAHDNYDNSGNHGGYLNENISNLPQESAYDNYNDYANYYENNSPRQSSPQNSQKYSLNNPFTDYTQSYEDVSGTDTYSNNRYSQTDMSNKRKSLNFMGKLNANKLGHFSSSSLPTTLPFHEEEKERPKFLTKRRNRTSLSFGRLGMLDSIVPHKGEDEKPKVKFSSRILLYDTYGEDEYDRKPESSTCNNLTPQLAMEIKSELNQFKSEMEVHEDSRRYTLFF